MPPPFAFHLLQQSCYQGVLILNSISSMISSNKIFKMDRKRQNFATNRKKRISLPGNEIGESCSTSSPAHKGHFVVYTADQKRFLLPLMYLNNKVFRELLKLSEEEFGLQSDGPITLPCDASFMEYIVTLIERGAAEDLEKALLISVVTSWCSSPSLLCQEQTSQQVIVCGH